MMVRSKPPLTLAKARRSPHGSALLGVALGMLSSPARADTPVARAIEPAEVQGVLIPGREAGAFWRTVAGVLLFVPRKLEAGLFHVNVLAARFARDEHIISRVDELFSPRAGTVTIFPTLFFASRQPPSAGARVLTRSKYVATSLAAGIGGIHDLSVDDRIRFTWNRPLPFVADLEALADSRSGLVYAGLGQTPEVDPRNHFRAGGTAREALYLERRTRGIADLGVRPLRELEILASGSYTWSRISAVADAGDDGLDRVFVRGSVPGAVAPTRIFYGEATARLDTRLVLGRPTPGVLVALYGGVGHGTGDDPTRFFRFGGRAAVFLPILRRSNILSFKLVVDGIAPRAPGEDAIPFTALVSQPDFRGYDTHKDKLGFVAAVDYRWGLMRFLGARIFFDAASVAPRLGAFADAPPRFAGGFGVDFFGETSELGQLAVAATSEGVRLLVSFGLSPAFRDGQHRD
jgi:hypothetical protein